MRLLLASFLLCLSVSVFSQGQSTPFETSEYHWGASGRLYCDQNEWRGVYYQYGPRYYQWAESFGNGATPNYDVASVKGYIVPKKGKLKNIQLLLDRNNSEAAPIKISIDIVRAGIVFNIITIEDNNYDTVNHLYDVPIDFNTERGDILMIAGQKVGGSTTRIYVYADVTLTFI